MSNAALLKMLSDPQAFGGNAKYSGLFRGFVESVTDPEKRGRVRVRVPSIHEDIPTGALPWAERCMLDGGNAQYGAYIPLRAESQPGRRDGDQVWIVFEGNNPMYPVVIGTWAAIPEGQSDLADYLQRPVAGQYRVHSQRTRHGHRVELIDEPGQHEIKITTARGDLISLRESDGGRGIHVETAEGNRISLQDEQSGVAGTPVVTDYDGERETRFAGDVAMQQLPFAPSSPPNGVPQSLTPGTAEGFGQQGILIETISGHKASMRDISNPGITIQSADGHNFEISDDASTLRMETSNGSNSVTLSENAGTIVINAATNVVVNAGNNVSVVAGSSIGFSAPSFSINSPAFAVNADTVVFNSPSIDFNTA